MKAVFAGTFYWIALTSSAGAARHRAHQITDDIVTREDGFMMLQFSVYARPLSSEDAALAHRRLIRRSLPPEGQVRVLTVTDHQFGKMEVYFARKRRDPEETPPQLMLF